jgi:hypothetical protein
VKRQAAWSLAALIVSGMSLATDQSVEVPEVEAARRAYWEGRFEVSIQELEPALGKIRDPDALREASFLLGLSHLALGRDGRSQDYFERTVRYDSDFIPDKDLFSPEIVRAYQSVRSRTVGRIVVRSEPGEARVYLGDRVVGQTPYETDLPTGEQTIRVDKEGHSGQVRRVQIAPGETTTVTFALGSETVTNEPPQVPEPAKPPEEFERIKLFVTENDLPREFDAFLRLEERRLVVLAKKGGFQLKSLDYTDIERAEYSYSKTSILNGKKHWLTVYAKDDDAVLQLDRRNYERICLSFHRRSGTRVAIVGEK